MKDDKYTDMSEMQSALTYLSYDREVMKLVSKQDLQHVDELNEGSPLTGPTLLFLILENLKFLPAALRNSR